MTATAMWTQSWTKVKQTKTRNNRTSSTYFGHLKDANSTQPKRHFLFPSEIPEWHDAIHCWWIISYWQKSEQHDVDHIADMISNLSMHKKLTSRKDERTKQKTQEHLLFVIVSFFNKMRMWAIPFKTTIFKCWSMDCKKEPSILSNLDSSLALIWIIFLQAFLRKWSRTTSRRPGWNTQISYSNYSKLKWETNLYLGLKRLCHKKFNVAEMMPRLNSLLWGHPAQANVYDLQEIRAFSWSSQTTKHCAGPSLGAQTWRGNIIGHDAIEIIAQKDQKIYGCLQEQKYYNNWGITRPFE